MTITCPACLTKFRLDEERIPERGAKARCSKCQHVFQIQKLVPPSRRFLWRKGVIPDKTSAKSMNSKRLFVLCFLICALVCYGLIWFLSQPTQILISLRDLPEISQGVLASQGNLFRVEEPFLYDRKPGLAVFVVEILSTNNFDDEVHLIFGGDAQSLQSFKNEIQMVNSGPRRVASATEGMEQGAKSIVTGFWQLLSHPLDTIKGLKNAAVSLKQYLEETPLSQVQDDVLNLADDFYVNRACEVAEKYSVDYFDLKTEAGMAAVHSDTNYNLGGQIAVELATFLVPFSKLKYGGEAAKIAEKFVDAGNISPRVAKFSRVGELFPRVEKMLNTLKRLKGVIKPSRFTPRRATLGWSGTRDYRGNFFERYPDLEGKVVVHHAVPQETLTRYKDIITEQQLHSLENLRGIPNGLDAKVHKSYIAKEWNEFYAHNPASTVTIDKLLDKATEIDRKFGHLFQPSLS